MADQDQKAFLAAAKRYDRAFNKAKSVKASSGYLEREDYLEAYADKQINERWNENAKIVKLHYGVSDKVGIYFQVQYVYTTGPCKGRGDSEFLPFEPRVGSDDTVQDMIEAICIAFQKAGVETEDLSSLSDLTEAADAYNERLPKDKTDIRINLQKRTYKPKQGAMKGKVLEVVNAYLGNPLVKAEGDEDDDEGDEGEYTQQDLPMSTEDDEEPEEEGEAEDSGSGEAEEDGFFEGDIVAYKPPRSRKTFDCEVTQVIETEEGDYAYNLYCEEKDRSYEEVSGDKLELVKEADAE